MTDQRPTWHELADKTGAVLDELKERGEQLLVRLLTPVHDALDAGTYHRAQARWDAGWHPGAHNSPWPTFDLAGIPTCVCGGVMDYYGSSGNGDDHDLVWACTCGRHLAMRLTRWHG